MAPIYFGEYITSTSLLAAHSSINVLSLIFPGDEAVFSLASFFNLVKREWNDPVSSLHLPDKDFSFPQIARAVVAWAALQGVTQEWQEKKWFKHLREIRVNENNQVKPVMKRRNSRVRVTSDVIFPGNTGQIIAADIGEAPPPPSSATGRVHTTAPARQISARERLNDDELKASLRRLSKLVLVGYGGASLLFFGISPTPQRSESFSPSTGPRADEEANLATAVNASEAEATGRSPQQDIPPTPVDTSYSWWNILIGKHDHQIFEHFANDHSPRSARTGLQEHLRSTATIGIEHQMPRFWVLTDHARGQIVLVIRGTMSLNEIAADLTCDREIFHTASSRTFEDPTPPGRFKFPSENTHSRTAPEADQRAYFVHSGILRMAQSMGEVGNPVHLAVHEALYTNPNYDLVLCGHSLGAGVATMLGLMWADPDSCLTVAASGLPINRRVFVYCFAPPCIVDSDLSRDASKLVVSFVYSHDVVSRLSLGSVRDLKNAASWLCDAEEANQGEGHSCLSDRAKAWKAGDGGPEDPAWFISMRKTLEANMHNADLYPAGRVLWAMRNNDLHETHRSPPDPQSTGSAEGTKLRLFEVLDVDKIFSQVLFAKDMLSSHMPHTYDRVLHDLL